MGYRPIWDVPTTKLKDVPMSLRTEARYRRLIELVCLNCGEGFTRRRVSPTYCSRACYHDHTSDARRARAKRLWSEAAFRKRIVAARRKAGYPDTNRPEAVARRKLRAAAKNTLRRMLYRSGGSKVDSIVELLGYSIDELRLHLEAQFQPGMTWLNHGEWEIDHIRPISSFPVNASISQVNALSNLQPLWKAENRSKGSKMVGGAS